MTASQIVDILLDESVAPNQAVSVNIGGVNKTAIVRQLAPGGFYLTGDGIPGDRIFRETELLPYRPPGVAATATPPPTTPAPAAPAAAVPVAAPAAPGTTARGAGAPVYGL